MSESPPNTEWVCLVELSERGANGEVKRIVADTPEKAVAALFEGKAVKRGATYVLNVEYVERAQ